MASDDEAFAQFAVIGKTLGQFRVRENGNYLFAKVGRQCLDSVAIRGDRTPMLG
ncbi:hypothetical protein [Alsobacter soli]|uniref:hypothetical protein n=1 Tax=Alsobacter soli TaxID=2109933 RepID=UPI001304EFE6|nr:hypothetical protein [Alsobacter soli]